mgnify:CR=1
MTTCRKCGWEINRDFGFWQDMYEGVVCDFNGDVPRAHVPLREVQTPNNLELAVA